MDALVLEMVMLLFIKLCQQRGGIQEDNFNCGNGKNSCSIAGVGSVRCHDLCGDGDGSTCNNSEGVCSYKVWLKIDGRVAKTSFLQIKGSVFNHRLHQYVVRCSITGCINMLFGVQSPVVSICCSVFNHRLYQYVVSFSSTLCTFASANQLS